MLGVYRPRSYQRCLWRDNWYTSGKSPLVSGQILSNFLRPRRMGPNCLTTFWEQLACRFNGRTAQPRWDRLSPRMRRRPTSRCQSLPVDVNSWGDKPVIRFGVAHPLSDLPYRNHPVISPFRPARLWLSQSELPYSALRSAVSSHSEEPLGASLQLWGRPPRSETARQTLSP